MRVFSFKSSTATATAVPNRSMTISNAIFST